ncbi:hypothetical protein D3C75_842910 [compost metagenome]
MVKISAAVFDQSNCVVLNVLHDPGNHPAEIQLMKDGPVSAGVKLDVQNLLWRNVDISEFSRT